MIDRRALLSDLQSLLKRLEADLLERSESAEIPEVGQTLRAEYARAKKAERTAQNYEDWRSDAITQAAAAWVLSCVFVRFLEDNKLIDPPKIAGPKERLQQARDEHTLYFQDFERAKLTDREYLLSVFDELARLPGTTDVFGEHNPIRELPNWLSGDAAGELLRFLQKIDPNTGDLTHDFTDPEWDTRFLGDLYQDLSEAARKKYALLQTPEFVEEFILDRTLDPALDEFGLTPETNPERRFKMIDPACGSGHFLLGAFPRILRRWQKQEPGTRISELVQRTLDSIHGVDINPFAIAIARFRLLLAALASSGVRRLADAPAFAMNLACGDSLYHGRQRQQTLGDWTDESHYFRTEDADNLRRILQEGTFHAVVANPPYITPKDEAANSAYRSLYSTCHRAYSLSVPFIERLFRLALSTSGADESAGYTGQITSNSFMKRQFGKKLIEEYFPTIDITHVVDTSGAYIPGHGTPTVIIFGRSRKPINNHIRAVMGIEGEPSTPDEPANGLVWTSIVEQMDVVESQNRYVSVGDSDRALFLSHPWSIGGGGAAELKAAIESQSDRKIEDICNAVGRSTHVGEDDAYYMPEQNVCRRGFYSQHVPLVLGEHVRDYVIDTSMVSLFPYDLQTASPIDDLPTQIEQHFWRYRTNLRNRIDFGQTVEERGHRWFDHSMFFPDRYLNRRGIAQADIATHNHLVLADEAMLFNRSAPVIYPKDEFTTDESKRLLCILNSAVACFWMKQTFHNKGSTVDDAGARQRTSAFEDFYQSTSTAMKKYPFRSEMLMSAPLLSLSVRVLSGASKLHNSNPIVALTVSCGKVTSLATKLETTMRHFLVARAELIRLQEDLDWQCYRLYGLLEDDLTYPTEKLLGIQLGERAFEIVLARKMARGEVSTTWFERHSSTTITELPSHWPDDYKQLVQRRIETIESNPQIALIEQPEYKRRWNTEPWDSQVQRALKSWLLDRLESYFDFDGRMNDEGTPTAKIDISLTSVAKLADVARQDEQFMEVAEVYRNDAAFDVQRLVAELVTDENVPALPVLRYKDSGLRKRAEWERTWKLQRLEDKLRAGEEVKLDDYELTAKQEQAIAKWQQDTPAAHRADDRGLDKILAIPVPPKYTSSDFISSGGARYWALRGKLDVPKERWVSFPHCKGPDGTLVIAWAGYDHLQLARAISAYLVDIQERLGGRDDPRLVPLLACIIELLPWLKQWHHDIDPHYNQRMDEVFEGFVIEEAKNLGITIDEIKAWPPPKGVAKRTVKRKKRANER